MSLKHLVADLLLAQHGRTAKEQLTVETYTQWNNGFIFDALKDQRYGQAFCNHFGITDNFLFFERNIDKCRNIIFDRYLKCNGQ